jgi:hypothetical protein
VPVAIDDHLFMTFPSSLVHKFRNLLSTASQS